MRKWIVAILLASFGAFCLAEEAPPAADDPVLEKRVKTLSEELRCLVCQNQSLADSNADLAIDLRNQVRELMQAGKSDEEIREFMVDRYGDFVLYSPPVKASTLVLWGGPFVLLLIGIVLLATYLRRRERQLRAQAMSTEDRARARALLDGTGRGEK